MNRGAIYEGRFTILIYKNHAALTFNDSQITSYTQINKLTLLILYLLLL